MDAELKALMDQGLVKQGEPTQEPKEELKKEVVKDAFVDSPSEPESEKVPAQKQEPSSFDYKGVLGEWAEPDKVITIPERLQKLSEYENEIQELKSRKVASFANDDIAKFNNFVSKTNISDFGVFKRVSSINLNESDPKELLAASMIIDNPELSEYSFEKLVKMVERDYKVDPDEVSEDDLEFNQIKLRTAAGQAKAKIAELQNEISKDATPSSVDYESLAKGWQPVVEAMANRFDKFEVKLDEQGASFEFAIPQEDRQTIAQGIQELLVSNAMPYTEDSVAQAQKAMNAKYLVENHTKIFAAFKAKIVSDLEKQTIDEYRRPSVDPNKDVKPDTPQVKSVADQIYEAEMGNM